MWRSTCVVITGNWLHSSGSLSAFDVIAAKRPKLQTTIVLPVETRNVARGNTIILSLNLCPQNSAAPNSTDNRSTCLHLWLFNGGDKKNYLCFIVENVHMPANLIRVRKARKNRTCFEVWKLHIITALLRLSAPHLFSQKEQIMIMLVK